MLSGRCWRRFGTGERFALGELPPCSGEKNGWNKNTVYTYLTRMAAKGLVDIDRTTFEAVLRRGLT